MNRRAMLSLVVLLASLIAVACGSDNPAGSSGPGTVTVQGMVLGGSAVGADLTASSASSASSAKNGKTVVTVAGTTITAEVSANGTFELKGIPSGSFVLIFTVDGVEVGRIELVAAEGSEVKITVKVENSQVTVIEIKIDDDDEDEEETSTTTGCFINGGKVGRGIELEGTFGSGLADAFVMVINGERGIGTVNVKASAASWKCNGNKANDCKAMLSTSSKLHVRGTLTTCGTSAAEVTATEVKVQKD